MKNIDIPEYLPDWMQEHIKSYLEDGEAAHLWDSSLVGGEGMQTSLLLATTGRKSGKKAITPLVYRPTNDGGHCVVASMGGAPTNPAWFLNLEAKPEVDLKVVNEEFKAMARIAAGKEREDLWAMMVEYSPAYAESQRMTEREFPVVVFYRL